MSFGLEVLKANGALSYTSSDVTWNQVDFFSINGNESRSNTYSALIGREALVAQLLVEPPPLDRRAIAHTITVNGGTVTVSGGSEKAYILVLMR